MAPKASGPQALGDGDGEAGAQSPEELISEAKSAFGDLFPVQKPRHVIVGIWIGVRCVISGVFVGIAGFVMQPFEGARNGGVLGFCKGLLMGSCTGLFFAVAGVAAGLVQAIRGVAATPHALRMAHRGWEWDHTCEAWIAPRPYSLPNEAEEVFRDTDGDSDSAEEPAATSGSSTSQRTRVADTYYYDQLGVAPSATAPEVRRAYYHMSRRWHPDKTSAKGAKEKFQAISEAYQVLSDPRRRKAYDSQGRRGEQDGFVDGKAFFNVLFGSDVLEPFVGKLKLSEMFGDGAMDLGSEEDADDDVIEDLNKQLEEIERNQERSVAKQTRRQVHLAVLLAQRLEAFVGAKDIAARVAFREAQHLEARKMLEKDPSLDRFLSEIGWVYRNRAELYLARTQSVLGGLAPGALRARLASGRRDLGHKASTARLAVSSYLQLRKIVNEADPEDENGRGSTTGNQEELSDSLGDALPTFMETLWSLTAQDVASTLAKVVERVLEDGSRSAEERRRRAFGLLDLGNALTREAAAAQAAEVHEAKGTSEERKRKRFEQAFMASFTTQGRS